MKIFKQKTVQTSNDYYEAYKAELSEEVQEKKLFTLSNFIKLEVLVIAVGFFILNQNSLSLELKKEALASNDLLPVSMQEYESVDKELVVTNDESYSKKIEIREDEIADVNSLEEDLVDNSELELLIKLLQSEMEENKKSSTNNKIIISQK